MSPFPHPPHPPPPCSPDTSLAAKAAEAWEPVATVPAAYPHTCTRTCSHAPPCPTPPVAASTPPPHTPHTGTHARTRSVTLAKGQTPPPQPLAKAAVAREPVCVSPISQRLSESTPFPPSLFLPHPRAHTHIASGRAGEGGEGGEGGKGGGGHGAGLCLTYPLPPSPHTRVWVSQASAWELAMSAVVDAASAAVAAGPPRRRRRRRGRRWHQPRCRRGRYVSRLYQTAPRCHSLAFSHKHHRGRLKGGMHRPGRRLRKPWAARTRRRPTSRSW